MLSLNKLIIFILLLSVLNTATAFNTSLNITTKMVEIRNNDGSINQTVFPVGLYGICNMYMNKTCDPDANPEFDFSISDGIYGNYSKYIPYFESHKVGTTVLARQLPWSGANAPYQNSEYIYFTRQSANAGPSIDEPDFYNTTKRQEVADNYNKSKLYYPDKLIYMNNYAHITEWLSGNYLDVFAWDWYANSYGTTRVGTAYSREDLVYATEGWLISRLNGKNWSNSIFENKAMWIVIAANALIDNAKTFPYTQKEARAVSWDTVAYGAQGLMFYGYMVYPENVSCSVGMPCRSSGGLVNNNTIRQWYGDIKKEMTSLNNILILPTKSIFWTNDINTSYTNVTPNSKKQVSTYWADQHRFSYILKQPNNRLSYLIVVNRDSTSANNIQIWVGGMTGPQKVTLLGNETSGSGAPGRTLIATDGRFNDSFDGYAVHIYQISAINLYPRYDVNEDHVVDMTDLTLISQNFNEVVSVPYSKYDVNMDGLVNIHDITIAGQSFGEIYDDKSV